MNRRLRILIAVTPKQLSRLIFDLLVDLREADIVCSLGGRARLLRYTQRVLPQLIIVDSRLVGGLTASAVDSLKKASPDVKVILTSWNEASAANTGGLAADACLGKNSLSDQLIPTIYRLCATAAPKASRPVPKRRIS